MVRFVAIPAGTVPLMDARRGDARTVELLPFEIATTPVTVEEVRAGRALTESAGTPAPNERATNRTPTGLPATGLRWLDAIAWCNAASAAEGLSPAYVFDETGVRWVTKSDGYRLPTEAEWVHACRAGTDRPRYGALAEIAWSAADHVIGPQQVAMKAPNAFGLYDMLGNVWEWCWDRLDPARYGDYRVFKGGGWSDPEWSVRVGVRRGNAPDAVVEDIGLRPVRGAIPHTERDGIGTREDGGQGWSEAADRRRAALPGPLPVGWTPLPQ